VVIGSVKKSTTCARPVAEPSGRVQKLLIVPSTPVGFGVVELAA
jgi:hypothetical protein